MLSTDPKALSSSFRDPSGFVFRHDGQIYRQVSSGFADIFDQFIESGLYQKLVDTGYLLSHDDVTSSDTPRAENCYRLLRPVQVPYISYPYEWCFSQLQDAALLTLRIQAVSLKFGFTLKDASAYNIQFLDGRPIFIDTLSFERHKAGAPWIGYRQFCQHFLAPLALSSLVDPNLSKLTTHYIDGVPLELARKLLPLKSRFSIGLQTHLHLHSKIQTSYADSARDPIHLSAPGKNVNRREISRSGLTGILESLASAIKRLKAPIGDTEWGRYYEDNNYSNQATTAKHALLRKLLTLPAEHFLTIHDLGANTGEFSRTAAPFADLVVSQDIDPVAVEKNYRAIKDQTEYRNILPLLQDLTAPSPGIGWANEERDSFVERVKTDLVMALALIHHLAIGNNVPLQKIAELFAQLGRWLIVEFVPKTDSQVLRMLKTREDIFLDYDRAGFESAFERVFSIESCEPIAGSDRTLYLMRCRNIGSHKGSFDAS